MVRALDLPTDIWAYILDNFLDVKDNILLLQTCRSVFSLYAGLNVWLRELRNVVNQDKMFGPSFNLDSMTQNDLKRAALAPERMASKIADKQVATDEEKSKLYPVSQRVLPFHLDAPILVMLLLPGGRYLIAKTQIEIVVIDTLSHDPPTAKMRQKNQEDARFSSSIFLSGPSSDGSKVRVATIEDPGAINTKIAILEFDPSNLELTRFGSRRIDQDRPHDVTSLHCDTIAGDLFCYFDSSASFRIYAWDFVRDIFVSWDVDPALAQYHPLRKLIIDSVQGVFIALTDRNALFWDLNEIISIKKSGHIDSFPPKWLKSFRITLFSDPNSDAPMLESQLRFLFSLNIWYYTSYPLPGFDMIFWDALLDKTYNYTFEIAYDCKKGGEPSIRLAQMHLIPNIHRQNIGIKHNRLCSGKTVLLWERYDDGRYFIVVKPTLVEDGSWVPLSHAYGHGAELVFSPSEVPISDQAHHGLLQSDPFGASTFDPVSGYLCTTSAWRKSVVISDYLGAFGAQ
ncbi:hypothetical protein BJ165DRAFT_1451907 [Panaeolus papilionaceus]|nr:hypothetical protein BJ165DRAFT_1451907 [Panaeolus papilionaceus]